ncbi:Zinc finger BED domain-containing protein 5 [Eumeta japonica]|uniref:Zinc finger BED domain-containing protein 5 n=1 Tax=Eumeta variegata TaxID=151549 RepID=A0A4C1VE70_EUMVA|nr:Zinc finger BED domain-containing protein 5 [Eumeta japonica]
MVRVPPVAILRDPAPPASRHSPAPATRHPFPLPASPAFVMSHVPVFCFDYGKVADKSSNVAEVSGNTEQSPDNDVSFSTTTPTQEKENLITRNRLSKKGNMMVVVFSSVLQALETLILHCHKTKHANLKDQSVPFFRHKLKDLKQRQKSIEALSRRMTTLCKSLLEPVPQTLEFLQLFAKSLTVNTETLLLHTEVRWLSRGRVVSRIFELRREMELFLVEQGHDEYKLMLTDSLCLQKLAYLSDIFTKLNELNLGLQGRDTTVFAMQEKVESTIKKISLWTSLIEKCKYDQFPNLKLFLDTTSSTGNEDLKSDIKCHLQNLSATLRSYFPEISPQWNWVNNPFANHSVDHLPISDQEELIDISCNSRLKSCFAEQSLGDFWANLKYIYHISESAIKYLLPFCTIYLCESGFSAMTNFKTKHCHRLQLEEDLRLKLIEGQPDSQELCKEKRAHLSH